MTDKKADGISETVSEKKKRGRPKIVPEWEIKLWEKMSAFDTARSYQNKHYLLEAMNALEYDPEFAWLLPAEAEIKAGRAKIRNAIMYELGRLQDRDVIRAVASRVCELKQKSKDAVAMIRRFRLGRGAKPDFIDLYMHIANALDDYLIGHPSTPPEMQARALRELADSVEEHELQKEGQPS